MRIPKKCALALLLAASLIMAGTVATCSPPVSAEGDGGDGGDSGDDGDGSENSNESNSDVSNQSVTITGNPETTPPSLPGSSGAVGEPGSQTVTITASRLGQDTAKPGLEDLFPQEVRMGMLASRVNDTLTVYTHNARASGAMLSWLNLNSASYNLVYGDNNSAVPIGYEFTARPDAPFTNVVAIANPNNPNNPDAWGFIFNLNFSVTTPPNTLTAFLNEAIGEETAPVPDANPPYDSDPCDGGCGP